MDFKYDPILGLQLTFGNDMSIIDIEFLPKPCSIEETKKIIHLLHQKGVYFEESIKNPLIQFVPRITSNTENL